MVVFPSPAGVGVIAVTKMRLLSFSFNLFAALFGPMWFGLRNIWNYALAFLIIETFAVVQIIRGLFGLDFLNFFTIWKTFLSFIPFLRAL